jgi:hypothetical protein
MFSCAALPSMSLTRESRYDGNGDQLVPMRRSAAGDEKKLLGNL